MNNKHFYKTIVQSLQAEKDGIISIMSNLEWSRDGGNEVCASGTETHSPSAEHPGRSGKEIEETVQSAL